MISGKYGHGEPAPELVYWQDTKYPLTIFGRHLNPPFLLFSKPIFRLYVVLVQRAICVLHYQHLSYFKGKEI